MSKLKDEIKENLENFKDAVKQETKNASLKNLKEDISDAIYDAKHNTQDSNETRKKGCLGKVIAVIVILCLISLISSKCGGDSEQGPNTSGEGQESQMGETPTDETPTEETEVDLIFLAQQKSWAKEAGIDLNPFRSEQKALYNWLGRQENENYVYVTPDNILGENKYKITSERSDYLYCGDIEDNYASGSGILFTLSSDNYGVLTYKDRYYNLLYIGEFSKGRFDGYGLKFNCAEKSTINSLLKICPYDESSSEFAFYYLAWINFVTYDGYFKDGSYEGLGNEYEFDLEFRVAMAPLVPLPDVEKVEFDSVTVGEFKNGESNGACKMFVGAYLWYDGEMKNGKMNGYGKKYYSGTNVLEYEGNYKNDMRHGSGTSYDRDGNVEYSGNWKNDDYA